MRLALIASLFVFLAAPRADAGSYGATLAWTSATTCNMCNLGAGQYACVDGTYCCVGGKSFVDGTPGGQVASTVLVTLDQLPCTMTGTTDVTVYINGVAIGPTQSFAYNCPCGGCSTNNYTITNVNGIPGWIYGGNNTLTIGVGANQHFCVARAFVTVTYTPPPVPNIAINPGSFGFGAQRDGTTSPAQTFTVTNIGGSNLVLNSIATAGPFGTAGFVNGLVLAPNGTKQFTASFSPVAPGLVNGSFTINSNAQNAPNLNVPLSGTGIISTAGLNPLTINFGNQPVGTGSAVTNVVLSNTGQAPLDVSSSVVTGPFVVSGLNNPVIAPNGMVTFGVTFNPTVQGVVNGKVTINSDDPNTPAVLTLTGVGTQPSFAAAPNPVNFGNVAINGAASSNVIITNMGLAAGNLTALAISGVNAAEFTITVAPPLPDTLQPNGTATVTVQFKPTAHGAQSATLVVTTNAGPAINVALQGTGTGGKFAAAPNPLDFGNQNITKPVTKPLTISNGGETALTVNSYTFGGANGTDFTSMNAVPFTVQPNATAIVNVVFTPAMVGARAGTLTFTSNDPLAPTAVVNVKGVGTSPMLTVAPLSLDFGGEVVGSTTPPKTVMLTNTGNGALTISNAVLGGPDAAQFNFTPGMFPVVLQPGQGMAYKAAFAPTAVGMYNGTITFTTDDPMQMMAMVPLTGQGTSPMISVDQMVIDFGGQIVGRTSSQRTLTVTNSGTATMTLSAIMLNGPQAADYAIVNPPMLPIYLDPGKMQTIALTLTPPMVGQEVAAVLLLSDDPNTPQLKVKLTGSGVSTVISVSPMMIDFGTVKAPGSAGPKMITITNSGGDPINLLDGVITGANASAFTVDSAMGTIMPSGTKTLNANFMAMTAGDDSATVTFATDDATIPKANVTMTGKAVSALIVAMPSTLDFGMVTVGTTSPTKSVMVMNQSTSPVKLGSVTSGDPTFVVTGADTTNAIAPGAGSMFNVAFAPSAGGAKSTKISITLMGGTSPEQTVMATGTGVVPVVPDMGGGTTNNTAGGCGCTVGGAAPPATVPGLALLALGLLLWLRRRR